MRTVEMKYGQNTTKWKTILKTESMARCGALLVGGAVVVNLPVERNTPEIHLKSKSDTLASVLVI